MIYFIKDGKPFYEYEPIGCNDTETWFNDAMERNQTLMWMKTIRWRLEKMSCVLVLRNKYWFQHAIAVLDNVWQTIVRERNNPQGYEHRAPKRRISPNHNANTMTAPAQSERKCLIDISQLELTNTE